jgi:hypothetical protein
VSDDHLDVRGRTPPEPMVAILAGGRRAPADASLVVRLDRDPVYLYPELAELGFAATRVPGDAGEVRLRIARSAS